MDGQHSPIIELIKTDNDVHGFFFAISAMPRETMANNKLCSDMCVKIVKSESTNAIFVYGTDRRRVHV